MTDESKAAFDFLSEATKQILTLATGIIVLTVTFTHDLLGRVSGFAAYCLVGAWFLYLISVAGGVLTMLAATGTLGRTTNPNVYSSNIRIPSFVQVVSFGLGLLATILFGISVTK